MKFKEVSRDRSLSVTAKAVYFYWIMNNKNGEINTVTACKDLGISPSAVKRSLEDVKKYTFTPDPELQN
ncbi:MAG: hypothetical protein ACOC2U_05665 [bacterium]